MKKLLTVCIALFATQADAQFSLGAAKSRPVPPATQNALHEAIVPMRLEAACRDYLHPAQRVELREAAGTAFVMAGYEHAGVVAALGEIDEMMAKQRRWTAGTCETAYASFRDGRPSLPGRR